MSDDEEVVRPKRQRLISEQDDDEKHNSTPGSNIYMSNEYMELDDETPKDRQAILEEFERRKKIRQINVSTDDSEVKKNLRHLGVPICLFGEGPAERRTRLRELIASLGEDVIKKKHDDEERRTEPIERGNETTWYHEGPISLKIARSWIAGKISKTIF